jgi:hypothetical protein
VTVTIAIPYSADAAPFIDKCIRSALGQTHKDVRVVVVGDGEVPPISFEDPRLVVHTLARNHGGAPFAQQVALLATPDKWYAPLGADDWLEPDHVERLLAEGKTAVATGLVFWSTLRSPTGDQRGEGLKKVWYETGLFRADRLLAFGGYDVSEQNGQDNCVLWLLEAYGGLAVRGFPPTYHRLKRYYGSVSVDSHGTPERRASDARTNTIVAAARAGRPSGKTRALRAPKGALAEELAAEVEALRSKIGRMAEMKKGGLDALILSPTWDPAGIGARYAAAPSRGGLRVRAAHSVQTYLDYPHDILWDKSTDTEIRQLAARADVVHINMKPGVYTNLGLDRLAKPAVLEHHGSAFRSAPALLRAQAQRLGMIQAVSTVDLLRFGDDLAWLPAPFDIDALAAIREDHARKPNGRVRVIQTPTSRVVKSTDKLEAAAAALRREGLPIDLVIGERLTWRDALALKATADIFFDQTRLGYGCSAIEAWGMGLPVVAGGDEWTETRMREEFGSDDLPFYKAEDTVEGIKAALRDLVGSADLRGEYGARGQAHARKFHGLAPALDRLAALYTIAMDPSRRPELPAQRPGRFRNTKYPALRLNIAGDSFRFVGGRLVVADGDRADLVRMHATSRPESGITEEAL